MFNYCKVLAAEASKLTGRPVRVILPREGVYRVVGGRAMTQQRVAIGAGADGHFESLIHTGVTATTQQKPLPEAVITMTRSLYAATNISLDVQVAEMNIPNNAYMRAPGDAVGSFALESAIDELADQLGIDPIELRLRNEPKVNPTSGRPFSSRHLIEAYRLGAERFGWSGRNWKPGTRREGEWLIGWGCATASYPYVRIPGGAAGLTLSKDGSVRVEAAAHDMGMGTATVQTQIIAERLGLPLEKVSFAYGDSTFPGDIVAGASQQTVSIGAAVITAHGELIEALLKLATPGSPLAGLKPEEVDTIDGALCKIDEPSRRESYTSLLTKANRETVNVVGKAPMPFEMLHWSMNSYGAQFCEVRVNSVTGETRVSRFVGAFDCGRILNAKTAASQFRGGIIMGIGLALMEETQFDARSGRIMNRNLSDYHVPVHMDVPQIDVVWTDIPDPRAPMGAHGIGEIGITGVGAAIANAAYHATGKRVRSLPITLDKLL
jgi:xanthine dehydrogenase YagR molybdenum-binding subunit